MKGRVNRDRHDIVVEILEKAKSGKNKTDLMREVGLSYAQSKQYLAVLLEKGLLEIDKANRYKTSKKGLEFLEKCGECLLFKWSKQKKTF
ncbi:MAG: winged helix-turn-helix domain-containing protein [Candidatus Bathycorpusculaceae bacterium]